MEKIDFLAEMANFTFTTKYARYDDKKGRRETWDETVSRVEKMHLKKYKFLDDKDKEKIKWAFDLVRQKFVSPSMRSMQFGGKAIEAHEARIFNCATRHIDSLRSFAESFYALLCGCGVTFGLTDKYLSRLPDLVNGGHKTGTVITYVVEDSIEGWADSVEALLNCYFKNTPYTGRKIVFDYSRIRPRGTPLKTGGGKAPGFLGLKNALKKIKTLLDDIIENKKQTRLKTINACDILLHCADAVLSGGIRRAACAIIFDKNDEDMLNAKIGKWFEENPQRARSNNSVLLLRNELKEEELRSIIKRTAEFGEPGFVLSDSDSTLYNPCFSIDTKILTEDGWRTFDSLIGKETNICQDKRVIGYLDNNKEKWSVHLSEPPTTVLNKAINIRKTGKNQEIYKLTLTCGRTVKATKNHDFATKNGMIKLENLKESDYILTPVNEIYIPDIESQEYKIGYLSGMVFGDGCFSNENAIIDIWTNDPNDPILTKVQTYIDDLIQVYSDKLKYKTNIIRNPKLQLITGESVGNVNKYRFCSSLLTQILAFNGINIKDNGNWLHFKNKDFKSGFLSSMFYCDGHVAYSKSKTRVSIRLVSINYDLLLNIQLILQELGSFSKICVLRQDGISMLPDSNRQYKPYKTQKSYRLIINGQKNCFDTINFLELAEKDKIKLESAKNNVKENYKKRFFSKVLKIEFIGKDDVYCLQEDNRRTLIAEGMTARRCFEVGFIPVTHDGRCGMQMCNLTSINGVKVTNLDLFKQATEAATIIGTLQAGYTNFPYLSSAAKELTEEESLLGVSITGLMDNPDILLNADNQEECALLSIEINKEWAKKIKINQAARITLVKPEGTNSIILGAASGIHPHHSRKYFRRIQMNKDDNVYQFFKIYNEHACEESVWSANGTDDVITFPIEVSENCLIKSDLTALKHLKIIKSTQRHWVDMGTTQANKKPLKHSTSCTVVVKKDEWDDVIKYLYRNRNFFSAVSLLPDDDKIYKQSPMQAVITKEDEELFSKIVKDWNKVDYTKLKEDDDATSHISEAACAGGQCEVIKIA